MDVTGGVPTAANAADWVFPIGESAGSHALESIMCRVTAQRTLPTCWHRELGDFVTLRGLWVRHGIQACRVCWSAGPGVTADPFSPEVVEARRAVCTRARQLWWAVCKTEERVRTAHLLPRRIRYPPSVPLRERLHGGFARDGAIRWQFRNLRDDWRRHRRWPGSARFRTPWRRRELELDVLTAALRADRDPATVDVRRRALLDAWALHPRSCRLCGDRPDIAAVDDLPAMLLRCAPGCDEIAALWWTLRFVQAESSPTPPPR